MINTSTKWSNKDDQTNKIPWTTFLILTVLFFFISEHRLLTSTGLWENFPISADDFAISVAKGSLWRRVAFLMLGLYGIIILTQKKNFRFKINGILGWLILFYFYWSFLSLFWGEDTTLTSRRLVVLAIFCLGALGVACQFTLQDIVLFSIINTGFYLLMGFITEIYLGTFQPWISGYRFSGTLHPNIQGINCSILFLSSVLAVKNMERRRIFFLGCAIIGFTFLLLTNSRTAFGSTLIVFLLYLYKVLRKSGRITLCLTGIYIFCLLFLFFSDTLFQFLWKAILLGREEPSTVTLSGRTLLWKDIMKYVAKHPFLGYGYDSFWTGGRIHKFENLQGWVVGGGHSAYLDLLLGVGLVGMVTYILMLVVAIRRSHFYYKEFNKGEYLYFVVIISFAAINSLLESSIVETGTLSFLCWIALARLGFRNRYE